MISKRLEAIVQIVGTTNSLVDVGADHGYVLTELYKRKKCFNLCGVENKIGPFNTLKNNVEQCSKDIKTILSDGLQKVDNIYDTVVIAGMGFSTIKKIISADLDKIKKSKNIILDSHNNLDLLRKFMNDNNFKIIDEEIIYEKGIYYSIIKYENGKENLDDLEFKYGPVLLRKKDETFLNYLKYKKENYEKLLENNLSNNRKENILNELKLIEKIINT